MQFLHGTHKRSADLAWPQGDILWFVTSKIVSFICSRNVHPPPYPYRTQQSCIHCFFHCFFSVLKSFLCQHGHLLSGSFSVITQVKYYICVDKGIWIFLGYSGPKTVPLNWIRSLHTRLEMFFSFIKGWKDHWTVNGPHQFNHLISQVYIAFLLISLQL